MKSDLGEAGYQLTTEDFFKASRGNDATALKKFVSSGFDLKGLDAAGDSALHAAAGAGAQDTADFLLDRGISIETRGAMDRTPLMTAVLADQTTMVRWLLRQGADAGVKDKEGFLPLMLAVREGRSGSVAELAGSNRDSLDSALLLAALVGKAESIDTLTQYGASIYAKMEDGRTPLIIAAQNGHVEAVKLLLDLGASRMSEDASGQTAADHAIAAGHPDIADLITSGPSMGELALQTPEEVAGKMDSYVEAAADVHPEDGTHAAPRATPRKAPATISVPIEGQKLSAAAQETRENTASAGASKRVAFAMPPLIMRHYRESDLPLSLSSVEGDTATFRMAGPRKQEVKVRAGQTLPGSRLILVRAQRRMEDSKLNLGKPMEVSVVEVRDVGNRTTREWISGVPPTAHDPIALVEDAATGRRYTASPGQRFTSADGVEFIVSDVRPNQLVIEEAATGAVQTIPLRGPRG